VKEFHRKYRPKTLAEVYGHEKIVKVLRQHLKDGDLPQVILFDGESGIGKTSLARILATELEVSEFDLVERNVADNRGIDDVRQLKRDAEAMAMKGKYRMWILDEVHQMTVEAQNVILQLTEDTPENVFLILCTTNPERLIKTLLNRCTRYHLDKLPEKTLQRLARDVAKRAKMKPPLSDKCCEKLATVSEGCARQCLNVLGKMSKLKDEKERLELIRNVDTERNTKSLAKELLGFGGTPKWDNVKAILKDLNDDAEKVRQGILAYSRAVVLGGSKFANRAMMIINVFRDWNISDPANAKDAVLVACCWEACQKK
jgi:DNA polymerase III subunit gamma/tau